MYTQTVMPRRRTNLQSADTYPLLSGRSLQRCPCQEEEKAQRKAVPGSSLLDAAEEGFGHDFSQIKVQRDDDGEFMEQAGGWTGGMSDDAASGDSSAAGQTAAGFAGLAGPAAAGPAAGTGDIINADAAAITAGDSGGTKTQPPPSATFWQTVTAQVDQLRRLYEEQRYGCFCGPGNVCDTPIDDIDKCCQAHDIAYANAGVSSTPSGTEVSMWSADGFIRTMGADADLVTSTQATAFDAHFYGPTAALYRAGVAMIFGGRVAIAAGLLAAQASDPTPGRDY